MKKLNQCKPVIMAALLVLVSFPVLPPQVKANAPLLAVSVSDEAGVQSSTIRSEFQDVTVITPPGAPLPPGGLQSEIAMVPGLDSGGYAVVHIRIDRVKIAATGESYTLGDGIGAFDASVTYPPGKLKMMGITAFPPFSMGVANLNAQRGTTALFNYILSTTTGPVPPVTLVALRVRLEGSKDDPVTATLDFRTIVTASDYNLLPPANPVSLIFKRGDANNDGSVNITDALFINQFLAGGRELGTVASTINPVNAASVYHDDGNGDKITVTDAMHIAQYLAGLRDVGFNLR